MAQTNLKPLIGTVNDTCRRALEAAAGLCMSRTHYNVEPEHWLLQLIAAPGGDLAALFRYYEVDADRVTRDLNAILNGFKTGNARPPALAPALVNLVREAWIVASVDFQAVKTRSAHLLLAWLTDETLGPALTDSIPEFAKIAPETLHKELADLIANTSEAEAERARAQSTPAGAGPAGGKTPGLDQFTIDLTAKAKSGGLDPVLGRENEVRQMIDILTRRRKNNPILTGEAGVGKTAVVEGFAQRISEGDVPPTLRNVCVRTLDLGLLQAGAGIKGEFENRLKSVIDEVKASPTPVILFIDEAHTLIGAGNQAGAGDAANLLKPALARGELRTIAATTRAEYKKYFEKDAALARRFQEVRVEEPTDPVAIQMMRGLVSMLEKHHKVRVLEEAVLDSVRLSRRYITGRQLPDKSFDLLDTACGKVAVSQSATPAAVEDCRRRIMHFSTTIDLLNREAASGADHKEQLAELAASKAAAEKELAGLETRWKQEGELVREIQAVRAKLEAGSEKGATTPPLPAGERAALQAELSRLNGKLTTLQGETPLLRVCVDSPAVAEVVSSWTGIPLRRMVSDEINTILHLREKLAERVVGQNHALDAIAQAIRTGRANLADPRKPIGVFLMAGTSGVGKTETALALAELLYGGEQNMTVINMSEFKEEHKVSLLMGSPPGYVGYGEGGVLTEAARRKPYSVILLDEMEKAHPGVQDVFYQVFDKGMLRDGEGRDIDFKNTVIIMTSNAGTDLIARLCADPETRPDPAALAEQLHPELLKTFKPAFLGRVTMVPYYPLADDVMRKIIELQLGRIARRVRVNYKAAFTYSPAVVDRVAERCREVSTGARNVDHIFTRTLLPELSAELLARMGEGRPVQTIHVGAGESGFTYEVK